MIRSFELRRRIDDLIYRFDKVANKGYKRSDGNFWIIKHPRFGWVAWDEHDKDVMGRPWNVPPDEQGDTPPEGEWVSRKGDKSYVYDLVHLKT